MGCWKTKISPCNEFDPGCFCTARGTQNKLSPAKWGEFLNDFKREFLVPSGQRELRKNSLCGETKSDVFPGSCKSIIFVRISDPSTHCSTILIPVLEFSSFGKTGVKSPVTTRPSLLLNIRLPSFQALRLCKTLFSDSFGQHPKGYQIPEVSAWNYHGTDLILHFPKLCYFLDFFVKGPTKTSPVDLQVLFGQYYFHGISRWNHVLTMSEKSKGVRQEEEKMRLR